MNHLNISEEQEKNLRILAAYLLSGTLKAKFNMSVYTDSDCSYEDDILTECGTVGCAAGHGPYAGIPKFKTENWLDYASRCFTGYSRYIRNWCFGGSWSDHDNTPEGAAKRILYILDSNNDLEICNLVYNYDGWCPLAVEKYNSIKL